MTRAGEIGGVLEQSLVRIADQLEKEDALRRQVKSAMVYPAVVTSVALIVMIVLVVYIVPVFAGVLNSFGTTAAARKLPWMTQITVDVSHTFTHYGWIILIVLGVAAYLFHRWKTSTWGRPQWDAFRLKIPFQIGDIVQKISIARWARTLSSLTAAGPPGTPWSRARWAT
jgi:type IV pilus assembly protein PilC